MSPGKHGPNRHNAYFSIHQTIMEQLLRSGFVTSEDLLIESDSARGYFMVGRVRCLGDIYIDVTKHIAHAAGDGRDPLIQTVQYGYNVALDRRGRWCGNGWNCSRGRGMVWRDPEGRYRRAERVA